MKEQLYTIPLMDAFREKDECPFCFIHRSLEQHAIDFTLGSGASYMEDDIRFQTDKAGFCKDHYQKMFLYGNRLGSALILETHLKKLTKDLKEQMEHYSTGDKPSLLGRLKNLLPIRRPRQITSAPGSGCRTRAAISVSRSRPPTSGT